MENYRERYRLHNIASCREKYIKYIRRFKFVYPQVCTTETGNQSLKGITFFFGYRT